MLIDLKQTFTHVNLSNSSTSERFDEFHFLVEDRLSQSQANVIALSLLKIGSAIPSRDRFEVTVSADGEAASASDDDEQSRQRISKLFEVGSTEITEVTFRIVVHKEVINGELSIYDLNAFGEYLDKSPLKHVLNAIASRLNTGIKLICSEISGPCGSAALQFVPKSNNGQAKAVVDGTMREKVISLFKESSFSSSIPSTLVPFDFEVTAPVGNALIDKFFSRARAVIGAAYLCNNLELDANDNIDYRLAGYKVIEEKNLSQSSLLGSEGALSKIANWAYDAGGSSDKVGLARNVLSLHVSSLSDLKSQPYILNAILSNYQIYLKGNVSTYLEIRGRMSELLLECTVKTHAIVESLLDSMRNGILLIFTFLLTVVVVNGLKDAGVSVIFSIEYFYIVCMITLLCYIWMRTACNDVINRYNNMIVITKQLLKDSYKGILVEEEIAEHTNATFAITGEHLSSQMRIYKRLWNIVSIVLIVAFLVGYIFTNPMARFNILGYIKQIVNFAVAAVSCF